MGVDRGWFLPTDGSASQVVETTSGGHHFVCGGHWLQWRALPPQYPHWNTVHRYHLTWSRDGTWERIVDRLRGLVRAAEGRERDPSGSVIDARSVRGASTVGSSTRG